MTGRASPLSMLAALGVLAGSAWVALAVRGSDAEALRGVLLGVLLGGGGSLVEAVLIQRELRRPRGNAFRVLMIGFGLRIVLLMGLAIVLRAYGYADAAAFALSFLGGFLSTLPMLASATGRQRNGEAHG